MKPVDNNIWQLAELHLAGTLGSEERMLLEERLENDPLFAASFQECMDLIKSLQSNARNQQFRDQLNDIHNTAQKTEQKLASRTIPLRSHYLRTASIAACFAVITSLITIYAFQQKSANDSRYKVLNGAINGIRHKQAEQDWKINKIQDSLKQHGAPDADVYSSGTGFAITNDGYIVTSYHVVVGADSVYIRTRNGEYYKTSPIAFDEKADIAVLKVEGKNFRVGKGEIPYALAANKSNLGARVFTLGFPEDNIVYNEGYVSSKSGYRGDSNQFRLDMTTNPGQSGAPILDDQGNIVAMVAANDRESQGTTYAVTVNAIKQLVHSLPKQMNLHLGKSGKMSKLSREQQLEKLQDYTCLVQVYKK